MRGGVTMNLEFSLSSLLDFINYHFLLNLYTLCSLIEYGSNCVTGIKKEIERVRDIERGCKSLGLSASG